MLNKCCFIGNLGADVEIRTFGNGGRVANIRLGCSERWKKDGQRRERTEWVSVAIFSEGLIGVAERFLKKGSKVYIEGKLQTRKWLDQQGNDRYSTEIILQGFDAKLVMLGEAGGNRDTGGNGGDGYQGGASQDPQGYGGGAGDLDDEIPF